MSDKNIKINEIFHSIQGEGKFCGINSIFIRTSGCNLNCAFCDSKYHTEGKMMSLNDIMLEIEKINSFSLVITGGEPMLWQDKIYELIVDLPHYVMVETNGTIVASENMLQRVDLWSVSPKLANSKVDLDKRINYDALSRLNDYNTIYKFVISDEKDIEEVNAIVQRVRLNPTKIWLMPEGVSSKQIIEKSKKIIELCKKYNFHFSPRLQTMIYDNKRGV